MSHVSTPKPVGDAGEKESPPPPFGLEGGDVWHFRLVQIIQIKHNRVKNSNWSEANQLAIYKHGRGFELGTTVKQIQLAVRAGLERGAIKLQNQRSNRSFLLPPLGGVTRCYTRFSLGWTAVTILSGCRQYEVQYINMDRRSHNNRENSGNRQLVSGYFTYEGLMWPLSRFLLSLNHTTLGSRNKNHVSIASDILPHCLLHFRESIQAMHIIMWVAMMFCWHTQSLWVQVISANMGFIRWMV